MKRTIIAACLALAALPAWAQQAYPLETLLEMASLHNQEIKNARLSIQAADQQVKAARTHYFPTVNAGAMGFLSSHDLVRTNFPLTLPIQGLPPLINLPISMIDQGAIATVTAMQPVYVGGQITLGNRLAKVQRDVETLKLSMTEKEVAQQVKDYYWQLIALRHQTATLDAADKQVAEVHQLVTNYINAGVATQSDLLRVEIKQQELQSQRLKLDNGIKTILLVLAQLCGGDMNAFDVASTNIDNPQTPQALFVETTQAVSNREEMQMLNKAVDAKTLLVKTERAKQLPTVAVGAAGVYYNVNKENLGTMMGLATISVPITDWWAGSHHIRRAKLALEQQINTRADAEEKLRIDVQVAWNALEEAWAQIEVARRSVAQADENLRMSRNRYDAGTENMTDLLDAVTLYTQSHSNLSAALATYQSRIADYQRKTL